MGAVINDNLPGASMINIHSHLISAFCMDVIDLEKLTSQVLYTPGTLMNGRL